MCAHFLSSSVSWSFLLRDPEAGVFLKYGLVVPVVVETGVSVTFPLKRLDLLRVTGELADSPLAGVAAFSLGFLGLRPPVDILAVCLTSGMLSDLKKAQIEGN